MSSGSILQHDLRKDKRAIIDSKWKPIRYNKKMWDCYKFKTKKWFLPLSFFWSVF